ncbi:fimbria/pilus outer membrane usher protein [Escherichia coli]|nr:fimbria/pilus outer membrane usher protein [Escherichia coli]
MLRMTPLASAIVALLLGIEAYAAEETFDTHFMIGGMKDQQVANIRLDDNQPLPGQYDIDIYVNKQWRGKYEIIVKDNPQETCLSIEVIKRLGINSDNFASGKQCLTFEQLVQGGSYTWDIGVFRLDFSVPQAWVEELESGYVPPENWERGINAFYTSYYVSQYYSDYKASGNSKSTYVRFNSGLNLLGWQLHSDASFSKTNNNPGVWKSNTLYLERGFAQLLGTLRVGDMYTSSDIFDSVRFSGVRLFRDMQMLPNSKQNFTPRVQGIAQSNALVTIEQNGFVVYQKEVPPGPFAITDLQLAGGGADLDVSVKEADGSVTTYLVPYAAVPNMLQPGVSKYDFAAGRSHIEGASKQSDFVQAGYQYGFNIFISIPFDWGDDVTTPRRQIYMSNSTTFDDQGFASNNTGLSGTVGSRDQFNYGVNLSYQNQGNETTAGANLTWNAPVATVNGSYSQSSTYRQAGASVSGGIVAWSGGVNLANRLSETFAVMNAPGIKDAYVNGQKYRTTNRNGVVVYDGMTPYRENHLMLDVSQSDSEAELRGNRKIAAPYRGAVVLVNFDTDQRKPWFIKALRADGQPLMFGYEVNDIHGHNIGVVGQGSQLFIRTNEVPPSVNVAIDKQQGLSCTITFGKEIDESRNYICQ